MAAMPSTWGAAVLAWRDTRRAFVAMPALVGIALAIVTALGLVEMLAAPSARGSHGLSLLLSLARAFVLAPYLIAVHRFIILGEVTRRYGLQPAELRFQRLSAGRWCSYWWRPCRSYRCSCCPFRSACRAPFFLSW